jgi:hypothetical protein
MQRYGKLLKLPNFIKIVGVDGVKPPELESNRFTGDPAIPTV